MRWAGGHRGVHGYTINFKRHTHTHEALVHMGREHGEEKAKRLDGSADGVPSRSCIRALDIRLTPPTAPNHSSLSFSLEDATPYETHFSSTQAHHHTRTALANRRSCHKLLWIRFYPVFGSGSSAVNTPPKTEPLNQTRGVRSPLREGGREGG